MDDAVREEVGHLFIDVGNKILSGNCVWNEEQMLEACNAIGGMQICAIVVLPLIGKICYDKTRY